MTITEPAQVKIENLFQQADFVAVIEIISGDKENYPTAVYKAKIVKPFKGSKNGDTIYFGPFVGYAIGNQYLAFLRRPKESSKPKSSQGAVNYGTVIVMEVMYQGYSFLPIEYNCVFSGKELREACDYGIKFSPDKLVLPKEIKSYPDGTSGGGGPHHWVRRENLLVYLELLSPSKQGS